MACRLKGEQNWSRNKMRRKRMPSLVLRMLNQNISEISHREKGADELKTLVYVFMGYIASRKSSSFSEPGPLVLKGLMQSLLRWKGRRQLVGAGLGTGLQASLHPPPLGLLDHCIAEQLLCSGCQKNLGKRSHRSSRDFHSGLREAS